MLTYRMKVNIFFYGYYIDFSKAAKVLRTKAAKEALIIVFSELILTH